MKKIVCMFFVIASFMNCTHVSTQSLTSRMEKNLQAGKPVLKIGDKVIHEGQVDVLSEIMPGFRAGWESPEDRKLLTAQLIEQELFYQKAVDQDLLTNNERLQKNLWLQIRNFQAGTYLLQEVDKRALEKYEKDKDTLYSQVEVNDILILFQNTGTDKPEEQKVRALKKAKLISAKLNSKNFGKIASEESDNPIAKASGGSIGSVSAIDQRVKYMGWKPLVDEALRLKKGKVSKPIVTSEGVHIIQVAGDKKIQSFEEVKPFLRTQLEGEVKNDLLGQMLKETKIEYLDASLAPEGVTSGSSSHR